MKTCFARFRSRVDAIDGIGFGYGWTANKNRQQSHTHASFVFDLGLRGGMPQSFEMHIFSPKYSLFWNYKVKNIKQNKIYGLSSFGGVKEIMIVWKTLRFSCQKNKI